MNIKIKFLSATTFILVSACSTIPDSSFQSPEERAQWEKEMEATIKQSEVSSEKLLDTLGNN